MVQATVGILVGGTGSTGNPPVEEDKRGTLWKRYERGSRRFAELWVSKNYVNSWTGPIVNKSGMLWSIEWFANQWQVRLLLKFVERTQNAARTDASFKCIYRKGMSAFKISELGRDKFSERPIWPCALLALSSISCQQSSLQSLNRDERGLWVRSFWAACRSVVLWIFAK